jgi:gamma-glutamyltranspeptidase/glutathione hydrolase
MSHRRILAVLSFPLLALAGCDTVDSVTDSVGESLGLSSGSPARVAANSTSVANRSGVAVADEPFAARIGAAILTEGGSAADAATAMFFALSATYPVAAGLGGGGICLVYNPATRSAVEFDFLTRAANRGGLYAIPGAPRGFHQMQRQFGALPWQRTIAPGEQLAGTGFPISQALAVRLQAAQNIVRLDAGLAAQFLDESGHPKPAGANVTNLALAQTLSALRLGGADAFYKGQEAERIVAYSNTQGGAISAEELAAYAVTPGQAARVIRNGALLSLPATRTGAGAFASALLDSLTRSGASRNPQAASAQAVGQALGKFGIASVPPDLGATGFAAVDVAGQAVACAVTLNGPFGSGHSVAGTGVVLAASPAGPGGLASAFLSPMVAVDSNGAMLAGVGAGGPYGTAAIAAGVLRTAAGQPPERSRELSATTAAAYDTVNAISCREGACVALPDPRAHGAGAASVTMQ